MRVHAPLSHCDRVKSDDIAPNFSMPNVLRERSVIDGGNPSLFRALHRRLNRGHPINILAVGSSLVAGAGCTAPLPMHGSSCVCPKCCGTFCGTYGTSNNGWALAVLQQINESWPHPQHALYNMGEPGGDVLTTLIACPRSFLSFRRLDLVLLDVTINAPEQQERVVRVLQRANGEGHPPPALVMPLFAEFTDRKEAKRAGRTPDGKPMGSPSLLWSFARAAEGGSGGTAPSSMLSEVEGNAASRDPRLAAASTSNGVGGPSKSTLAALVHAWHTGESIPPLTSSWINITTRWARSALDRSSWHGTYTYVTYRRTLAAVRLARHYGFALVSLYAAFAEEFETHEHGLHLWMLACRDGLHPNATPRAETMVATLITHALRRAMVMAALADEAEAAASIAAPPENARSPSHALPPPLDPLPARVGVSCFTFDSAGWEMMRGSLPSNRPNSDITVGRVRPVPTILTNRGWTFVTSEPSAPNVLKPGLVAHEAGDELQVEIDTSHAVRPILSVQYLTSWEHMGTARLSCEDCRCESVELRALRRDFRMSVMATQEVNVSAHEHCRLRLHVLNETEHGSGRGHKFKIERLLLEDAVSR